MGRRAACSLCGHSVRGMRDGKCLACRNGEALPEGEKCVHCKLRKRTKAKGLCYRCSNSREIRTTVAALDVPWNNRGHGVDGGGSVFPGPTSALPGTEGKVAALEYRARLGLSLWSDGDARWDGQVQGRDGAPVLLAGPRPEAAVEEDYGLWEDDES